MEIQHLETEKKGKFFLMKEGTQVAEMTYTYAGPKKMIIDHTEVDERLKGQGVGNKLVEAAVSFLRKNEMKVIPLCPFAKAVFDKKSEEYSDVLF